MSDGKVSIIVHTEAELSALKDAREQIAALQAQCQEGSAGAQLLGNTLASVDKVIKGGVGGSIPEAAHHLEIFGLKGHEAHIALRLIGGQLGEVGHLLHFAFAPELAGIVAVVLAIKAAKDALGEYNKTLDEAATLAAKPMTRTIYDVKEAWDKAQQSIGEYQSKLDNAGKDSDPLTKQIKNIKALSDAAAEAEKAILQAAEAANEQLARLTMKAQGATDETIELAISAMKAKSEAAIKGSENAKPVADLEEEGKKRLAAVADLAAKEAAARDNANKLNVDKSKELAAARALVNPTDAAGKTTEYQTGLDIAAKEVQKIKDDRQRDEEIQHGHLDKGQSDYYNRVIAAAQDKYDKLLNQRTGAANEIQSLESHEASRAREGANTKKAAEDAAAANLENRTRIQQIYGKPPEDVAADAAAVAGAHNEDRYFHEQLHIHEQWLADLQKQRIRAAQIVAGKGDKAAPEDKQKLADIDARISSANEGIREDNANLDYLKVAAAEHGPAENSELAQARALKAIKDAEAEKVATEKAKDDAAKAQQKWIDEVQRVNEGKGTTQEQQDVANAKARQDTAALSGPAAKTAADAAIANAAKLTGQVVPGAPQFDATGKQTVPSLLAPPAFGTGIDTDSLSKAAALAKSTADKTAVLNRASEDRQVIESALALVNGVLDSHASSITSMVGVLTKFKTQLEAKDAVAIKTLSQVQALERRVQTQSNTVPGI